MKRSRVVASFALLAATLVAGPVAAQDASVAPSPESPPAFVCGDDTMDCAGPLTAGEHASVHFDRPFSFTATDGWTNVLDRYRAFQLSAAQAPDSEFIVWSHAAIPDQTPECEAVRKPGVGTMTEDWLAFLADHPGLDVSEPVTVDLGGRPATSVEVTVKGSWTTMCPFNTDPFVLLVTDSEEPPTRNHGVWLGGRAYMGFVDVGEEAVIIWVDGADGQPFNDMVALAQPVIESIRFEDPVATE